MVVVTCNYEIIGNGGGYDCKGKQPCGA